MQFMKDLYVENVSLPSRRHDHLGGLIWSPIYLAIGCLNQRMIVSIGVIPYYIGLDLLVYFHNTLDSINCGDDMMMELRCLDTQQ